MPSRKLLLLALLLLVPIAAEAQRRGGGGGGGGRGGGRRADFKNMGAGNMPISISNKDIESMSPVKVLLDKKKDLTLTDDQVKQLKALDVTLKTNNDTLWKAVDSLRKEMKVNNNAANPQVEQIRVRGARTSMVEVIKALKESFDAAEPDALKVLTEDQQKTAGDLLEKHQAEAESMLQEKLGGGKGGGRPEGGERRPPA